MFTSKANTPIYPLEEGFTNVISTMYLVKRPKWRSSIFTIIDERKFMELKTKGTLDELYAYRISIG